MLVSFAKTVDIVDVFAWAPNFSIISAGTEFYTFNIGTEKSPQPFSERSMSSPNSAFAACFNSSKITLNGFGINPEDVTP